MLFFANWSKTLHQQKDDDSLYCDLGYWGDRALNPQYLWGLPVCMQQQSPKIQEAKPDRNEEKNRQLNSNSWRGHTSLSIMDKTIELKVNKEKEDLNMLLTIGTSQHLQNTQLHGKLFRTGHMLVFHFKGPKKSHKMHSLAPWNEIRNQIMGGNLGNSQLYRN